VTDTLNPDQLPKEIHGFFNTLTASESTPQSWSGKKVDLPESLKLGSSETIWRLELDEEIQVIESRPESQQIVLRSVRSIDKVLGIDRPIGYTEVS